MTLIAIVLVLIKIPLPLLRCPHSPLMLLNIFLIFLVVFRGAVLLKDMNLWLKGTLSETFLRLLLL